MQEKGMTRKVRAYNEDMVREYDEAVLFAKLELAGKIRRGIGHLIDMGFTGSVDLGGEGEEREGHAKRMNYGLHDGEVLGVRGEVRLSSVPFRDYRDDCLRNIGKNVERALKSLEPKPD